MGSGTWARSVAVPACAALLVGLFPTSAGAAGPPADPVDVIVRLAPGSDTPPAEAAAAGEARTDGTVVDVFTEALPGYVLRLPADQVDALRQDPDVASVTVDTPVHAADVQTPAPPNLDRIDDPGLPGNGSYRYDSTGAGVTVYVIDSGLRISHNQFGGRAVYGYDFVDDDPVAQDCDGHGTHVAGTIGGRTFGAAKQTRLVALRVLDCAGAGMASDVIAAVDWILTNRPAGEKSVINASVTGPPSAAMDAAFAGAVAAGIPVVAAAGNTHSDSCALSPARVASVITVGAVDSHDRRADFSNYGACVGLWAPGVDILSAGITSNTATNTLSGTSMAAPLVTGAIARYLQDRPGATPAQLRLWLQSSASGPAEDTRSGCAGILQVPASTTGATGTRPAVLAVRRSGTVCVIHGSNSGGTVLTLTGTNLAGVTAVTVGGVPAVFTVNSADTISLTTPAATVAGRQPVVVTSAAGSSPTTPAATFRYDFRDVPSAAQFYVEITRLAGAGVVRGYGDGTFRPATVVDRGTLAVMFYRYTHPGAADPSCKGGKRLFMDVRSSSAQCGAVEWLAKARITTGFADGTFRPADPVTRGPLSAMMVRLLNPGLPDPSCRGTQRSFADVAKTTQFCGSIEVLADLGVTTGYQNRTFRPAGVVRRDALAAFVVRLQYLQP